MTYKAYSGTLEWEDPDDESEASCEFCRVLSDGSKVVFSFSFDYGDDGWWKCEGSALPVQTAPEVEGEAFQAVVDCTTTEPGWNPCRGTIKLRLTRQTTRTLDLVGSWQEEGEPIYIFSARLRRDTSQELFS